MAAGIRDVILPDGRTMRLAAPCADRDAIRALYRRLSAESRYARFHGIPVLDEHLVDPISETVATGPPPDAGGAPGRPSR